LSNVKNLKVWKKYELQKIMKSILPKNCHFVMKNQYCRNIAIFTKFMPKICHELDKYLPNFLSSIWQPCRYLCSDQTRQSIDCLSLSVSEPAALVTASLRDYVTFPSRFRADL